KHGLVLSSKTDVELPAIGARLVCIRKQSQPPAFGNQRQHRVLFICGIAGEVNSRIELEQYSARINRYADMRGLHSAVEARNTAGLYGFEIAEAVFVGCCASEAGKRTLRRRNCGMFIFTFRVRLPEFDHGVGDRNILSVKNSAS